MNADSVFGTALLIALSGCGITTVDTPRVTPDFPISPGYISNDIVKPEENRYSMALICGHFVERGSDGLYTPLGIAAYEVGRAPIVVAASDKVPNDYYSLVDSGGQAALQLSYGLGSGTLSVQGEDRLEVTVRPVANCVAPNPGKAVIIKAVGELSPWVVDRSKIYYVTSASQEEMIVTYLLSISKNASGAATPIVNIGGSVFSKQDQRARRDYISINPIKVDTTLAAPIGTNVTSPEPITASPLAKEVLGTPSPPSTSAVTLPIASNAKEPVVTTAGPTEFLQMRRDVLSNPSAQVTK